VYDFGSRYIDHELVCDAPKAADDAGFRVSVALMLQKRFSQGISRAEQNLLCDASSEEM
jgi:hypothetical protein